MEEARTHIVRARVTEKEFMFLLMLGRGDMSKGIRAAMAACNPEKVAEVQKLSERIAEDAARLRALTGT